jgi:hypothetical protein
LRQEQVSSLVTEVVRSAALAEHIADSEGVVNCITVSVRKKYVKVQLMVGGVHGIRVCGESSVSLRI